MKRSAEDEAEALDDGAGKRAREEAVDEEGEVPAAASVLPADASADAVAQAETGDLSAAAPAASDDAAAAAATAAQASIDAASATSAAAASAIVPAQEPVLVAPPAVADGGAPQLVPPPPGAQQFLPITDDELVQLLQQRAAAKAGRDFSSADYIRAQLEQRGIKIHDARAQGMLGTWTSSDGRR